MAFPNQPTNGKRVIIATANWSQVKPLISDMEKHGLFVSVASSGGTALPLVYRTLPDAILLDTNLPDQSAVEICRHIKSNEKSAGTIVVIYSPAASATSFTRKLAESVGADAFLTYTNSPTPLLHTLSELLRRRNIPGEGERFPA